MPLDFFGNGHAWSVTVSKRHYQEPSKKDLSVTLQPVSAAFTPQGAPLEIERLYADNGGFGGGPAVIFRPKAPKYGHDQIFKVTIAGLKDKAGKPATIEYITHFIDLKKIPDGPDVQAVNTAYFAERVKEAQAVEDEYERLLALMAITESKFIGTVDPAVAKDAKDGVQALLKKTELRKSVELMEKTLLEPMALALKRRLRAERESEFRVSRVVSCGGSCVGMDR